MLKNTLDEFNMFSEKFKVQNYDKIKRQCLENSDLFKDNTFPANDSILFKTKLMNGIVWKRPHVKIKRSYKLGLSTEYKLYRNFT